VNSVIEYLRAWKDAQRFKPALDARLCCTAWLKAL